MGIWCLVRFDLGCCVGKNEEVCLMVGFFVVVVS